MSWLNLNDSLNNLKGQISNFASGVLADGIVNDTDPFAELAQAKQKIEELQTLCASQDVEIAGLRRQNADFYEKLSSKSSTVNSNASLENGDNWFWDPPASESSSSSVLQENEPSSSYSLSNTSDRIKDLTEKITLLEIENEKLNKQIRVDNIVSQNSKDRISELEKENKDLLQNLEQLDLDCQNTTDKLVTLKDNLQEEINKLKLDYEVLKQEKTTLSIEKNNLDKISKELDGENKKIKSLCLNLEKEVETLKNIPKTETPNKEEIIELKSKLEHLNEEKNNLDKKITSNDQLISKLKKERSEMKIEIDSFKKECIPLDSYKKLQNDYENIQRKFAELEQKNKDDQEKIYKLNNDFAEMKLQDNSNMQINLSDDHKKLQDMFEELKLKYESVVQECRDMHKKYVGILTDNVKKFVDHELPEEFTQKPNETPLYSEFTSKVEATLKLLLDYKWKTETLEKKLCEITREKNISIAEKNHEIEKLLHNSEILSQEVITKTQIIKDYENECTELLSELQQYKNNNGLQTISESNEDNLLLLENQLESANKRIKELELIISDMENSKQDTVLETQTELDYIKKQLNMTGEELSQNKEKYQELLQRYNQSEINNNNIIIENKKLLSEYEKIMKENHNVVLQLEKHQNEMENMEYKYMETNTEKEALIQELSHIKEQNLKGNNTQQELQNKNSNLTIQVQNFAKQIKELETKHEALVNINHNLHKELNDTKSYLEKNTSDNNITASLKNNYEAIVQMKSELEEKYLHLEKSYNNVQLILTNNGLNINNLEESIAQLKVHQNNIINQNSKLELQHVIEELESSKKNLEGQLKDLEVENSTLKNKLLPLEEKLISEKTKLANEEKRCKEYSEMVSKLNLQIEDLAPKVIHLQSELNKTQTSNTELLNFIQTKHQENIQYHAEIQRLNNIIAIEAEKYKKLEMQLQNVDNSVNIQEKDAEIDRLKDQNHFLKEKCEKLAQSLLEEQSNMQKTMGERQILLDREQSLAKELERLRQHMVEIEDSYTQELLQAEQRNQEMQSKVNEIEQRERDSSTIYTSVSIRANQQVETLQNQLQLVTTQRDELQNKISEAEDKNNKQFAALTNLQCVLEQFQKDKDVDIANETERIKRQIKYEKDIQSQLQAEINTLKTQLQESKQGLLAASRLSEQLERSKQQVVTLKDEVTTLQDSLKKTDEKYRSLLHQTDAKVDKALVKNLVVGFVSANNNLNKDQTQILKIISTVLDFSQQDNEKLKLNKQPGSWLQSILHPQSLTGGTEMSQQSLSEAFVRFLESESQPKNIPGAVTLLNVNRTRKISESSTSSRQGTSLLNEVVLPTFADFAQSRSSSAILKDVLKDNN